MITVIVVNQRMRADRIQLFPRTLARFVRPPRIHPCEMADRIRPEALREICGPKETPNMFLDNADGPFRSRIQSVRVCGYLLDVDAVVCAVGSERSTTPKFSSSIQPYLSDFDTRQSQELLQQSLRLRSPGCRRSICKVDSVENHDKEVLFLVVAHGNGMGVVNMHAIW